MKIITSILFSLLLMTSVWAQSSSEVSVPFGELKLPKMESWSSYKRVKEAFRLIRDTRFFDWSYRDTSMKRRIFWLYPHDGCDVRAYYAVDLLKDFGEPLPRKVFAFGSFGLLSDYFPGNLLIWKMHVAPIVRVKNRYYVLDPSLNFKKPLRLKKWLNILVTDVPKIKKLYPDVDKVKEFDSNINEIAVSICDSGTLNEVDDCFFPSDVDREWMDGLLDGNLTQEWLNLRFNFGYEEPSGILGNSPPWN